MGNSVMNPDTLKEIPAGRLGEPDDLAALILLMASKAGSYHNGAVHLVDGAKMSLFPAVW